MIGYGTHSDVSPETLEQQAHFILNYIEKNIGRSCWLLGHSVGGAIAFLAARLAPTYVKGLISVEGNFTLKDAFWCDRISQLPSDEWDVEYAFIQKDSAAWLSGSVAHLTPERIAWATTIVRHQPARTVQAQRNMSECSR